jgi:hypothetical protein
MFTLHDLAYWYFIPDRLRSMLIIQVNMLTEKKRFARCALRLFLGVVLSFILFLLDKIPIQYLWIRFITSEGHLSIWFIIYSKATD